MSDDALIAKAAEALFDTYGQQDWGRSERIARAVVEAVRDQIAAEALREVDAACDRLCWGDYLGTDGSRHYGAALVPKGGVGRMPGFRDWLRDRADRLDPREGA